MCPCRRVAFVGLFERERDGDREGAWVCVCFHLLHNREWRQSVLPCLPHYSGSSVGVREATACLSSVPQPGLLLVTTLKTQRCITKRETKEEWWWRLCQVEGVCCLISSATEWTTSSVFHVWSEMDEQQSAVLWCLFCVLIIQDLNWMTVKRWLNETTLNPCSVESSEAMWFSLLFFSNNWFRVKYDGPKLVCLKFIL